jgi:outer membrane receptor protein involved in Fe transport
MIGYRRSAWLLTTAFTGLCMAAMAAPANAQDQSQQTFQFDIPAESLGQALTDFSSVSSKQILMSEDAVKGRTTKGIHGRYTASQALDALLAGTGLEAEVNASGVLMVQSKNAEAASNEGAAKSKNDAIGVEDVVVTATRRPEEVRSIAGSVTAFSGNQLDALGAQGFADYLTRTPGVVFNYAVPGDSTVVIRGVSTSTYPEQGQGTTGLFINDVPLTDPFHSVAIPDIDTFDVDNVAILRGPQGTLFGSASMGGAVNYQAAKPNLEDFQTHLQAMLNVPIITDELAVRGVFIYRQDPGFIDNIGTGRKNSNRTVFRGGRFEATWAPTSSTTLNYLFLQQSEATSDLDYAEPGFAGKFAKNTVMPEPFNFGVTINSLRLDQVFDAGTLTLMASDHRKSQREVGDFTLFYNFIDPAVSPYKSLQIGNSHGDTYEARFASPTGGTFEYLVGAFHDRTHEFFDARIFTPGANTADLSAGIDGTFGPGTAAAILQPGNTLENDTAPFTGSESAVYGEASYRPVQDLKLTFGGRYYHTTTDSTSNLDGLSPYLDTGSAISAFTGGESDSGFLPKGSVTWTPNGDVMLYGLVSTGFRYGGANINSSPAAVHVPPSYGPDSLTNYEIGTRTNWFDRTLQLDATAFYIDWSNIQLQEYAGPGDLFGVNAGKARNDGVEFTGTWEVTDDLTLQSNLTYLSATLAQTFNPGGGQPVDPKGATLPGASKWQIGSTLSYRWRDAPFTPTFVLSERFISRSPGYFGNGTSQGNYTLVDGRVSFEVADSTLVTAFVNNIGNARGDTNAFIDPPLEQTLLQPRTFGITVDFQH